MMVSRVHGELALRKSEDVPNVQSSTKTSESTMKCTPYMEFKTRNDILTEHPCLQWVFTIMSYAVVTPHGVLTGRVGRMSRRGFTSMTPADMEGLRFDIIRSARDHNDVTSGNKTKNRNTKTFQSIRKYKMKNHMILL